MLQLWDLTTLWSPLDKRRRNILISILGNCAFNAPYYKRILGGIIIVILGELKHLSIVCE